MVSRTSRSWPGPDVEQGRTGEATDDAARRPGPGWRDLLERAPELAEYASYYAAVQADRMRVAAQKTAWRIAMGACLGLVGVAAVATAAILVVVGLAGAVGQLFRDAPWAGQLIVGAVLLLIVAAAFGILRTRAAGRMRKGMLEKYAKRQRQQLAKFGRNVGSTAGADHGKH